MTTWIYAGLLVLGLTLLVLTVVRVILGGIAPRPYRTTTGHGSGRLHARQILDERYAAGQLSTEEYQRRLRVLEEST